MKKIKKVAVVMGGFSSEREISLASGKGVAEALRKRGYTVQEVDLTEDMITFVHTLQKFKPDVVFNALHGFFGEDGGVQSLLDVMHIRYTHSGVDASMIGMDKSQTRLVAKKVGVPVAKGGLKNKKEMLKKMPPLPYVAKPNADGSSVGVVIVRTQKQHEALMKTWGDAEYKLVEEYIPGRELSAAVLNGKCLGIVEIVPKTGFYDFKNKYTDGQAVHIVPAPIPLEQEKLVSEYAVKMHKALGCRGVSRSDFRYDTTNPKKPRVIFLEINTNPGMTPFSLVPDIAKYKKISYDELVDTLVKGATCD